MKTFKNYLKENWSQHKIGSTGLISHKSKVHGHDVKIDYINRDMSGHHALSFSVNGKVNAKESKVKPHHAISIIKHVTKNIHEFKEKHNPKSIRWIASDSSEKHTKSKTRIYKNIAKRAGATVSKKTSDVFPDEYSAKFK